MHHAHFVLNNLKSITYLIALLSNQIEGDSVFNEHVNIHDKIICLLYLPLKGLLEGKTITTCAVMKFKNSLMKCGYKLIYWTFEAGRFVYHPLMKVF